MRGENEAGEAGLVPPSRLGQMFSTFPFDDGSLFRSIHSGRPQGMPAYGAILPEDAIWKIVTYLRAQPVPEGVPTESWRSTEH